MRTATTAVLAAFLAAIVGGSAASGCYGATEISVAVTTTVSCSASLVMTTQIFTGAAGTTDFGTAPAAETVECGSSEPRIGTLSVVPSGARDGQFDLEVVGAVGVPASDCRDASLGRDGGGVAAASSTTGCVVARRRVSFRPHKALTVPVLLSARCIGVPCGADQTCDLGICTSTAECTDQGCPRERGDVPAPVADASADAPTDAPVDAPVNVDASVPRCGTSPEVVISGQAIVGQLVMQGLDFVYVNAVPAPGGGSVVVTEIRRVPRAGAMTAQVVNAPVGQSNASYVAVAARGADLAWATQAAGPTTEIVWPKLNGVATGSADQTSLAISGHAVVGFWQVSSQFGAFALGGTPASLTLGVTALPGAVPEVLVDDLGDYYGVSGGVSLLHYTVADPVAPVQVGSITTLGSLIPDIAVALGRVYVATEATESARGRGIFRIVRANVIDTYSDPVWLSIPTGALPQSMTSDSASLYYLAGTSLSRADVVVPVGAPGVGIHVEDTGPSADRLQVDAQCVYWVEGGTTIMKRAKQ